MYGLKKSPKYWYELFHETVTKFGYTRSENDCCLYVKENTYLLLYVDDLLILGSNLEEVVLTKQFLPTKFKMKDLGDNNFTYLGNVQH